MSEITDKDLEVWIEEANSVLNSGGSHVSAASTILALCEHIQQCRRADPVADVVAWHREGEERTCDIRWRRHDVAPGPLYAVQQPELKDHQIRELVNELRDIAIEYHGAQQLRERIARAVRNALNPQQ